MAARRFLMYALLAGAVFALPSCKLGIDFPDYSLNFEGEILYDPSSADVTINYTFVGEEAYQSCRYGLTRGDGTIIDPEQTKILASGQSYTYEKNLTGYADGVYWFRVVVQAERSSGDYADLSFLDKKFEIYLDGESPVAPSITLAEDIYVGDQLTSFSHPEWSDPEGSPVDVYYTLDDSDPAASGVKFNGSPVSIHSSATPVVIKAVAKDMAGHNGPGSQKTIRFLKAESVAPDSASRSDGTPQGYHIIEISGYGFCSDTKVELYDADDTEVSATVFSEIEFDHVVVTINLTSGVGGSSLGVDTGMGQLVIRNEDTPSLPTAYLPFEIID